MLKNLLFPLSFVLSLISHQAWGSARNPDEAIEEASLHSTQKVDGVEVARYHYEAISSTQHAAKKHRANLDETHWSLTTADSQIGGFGYWDRQWVSPPGNVFATYNLPFHLDLMPRMSLLAPVVGLAIVDTLKALGINGESIGLRWVNNVLVGSKKIAGCIISGDGETLQIGIGLNVDLTDDVIDGIDQSATALAHLLDETPTVKTVLEMLTNCLVVKLKTFLEGGYNPIQDYREKLLYVGEEVTIFDGETYTTGNFNGINTQGFLLLERGGKTTQVLTGEISPKPKASTSND